jgi:oxygen-independent coproporphyrinogen-3 oxidase
MTLGVYIQVPFCQTKCTYCNFHTGPFSRGLYDPYVAALCREIRHHAALHPAAGIGDSDVEASFGWPADALAGRGFSRAETPAQSNGASTPEAEQTVNTVYVGGGTPSLLDPAALTRILDTVRTAFDCSLEEVTLEADPETITPEKAAAWLRAGFNRISLGAQSFDDKELRAAGRLHRREHIYHAHEALRTAGFRNLSFDLIAGLPHQAADSWEDSLDQLLALRPDHVSIYLLEIDEGSRLGREVLAGGQRYSAAALPSDDDMADSYERACTRLASAGYEHYEISNWALPGFRSRHNLKYWRREPYLGFGAGAHSFNGRERWANTHDPAAYVAAITQSRLPIEQHERLTPTQAFEEELFLGLRLLEGIDLVRLEQQYNVPLAARFASLRDAGLIEMDGATARLAPSRLAVSNEVFVELLT